MASIKIIPDSIEAGLSDIEKRACKYAIEQTKSAKHIEFSSLHEYLEYRLNVILIPIFVKAEKEATIKDKVLQDLWAKASLEQREAALVALGTPISEFK